MCTLARASGCTTVIAVDIEQGKLDFAKEMDWATGTYTLPRGPRVSGADALEVAKKSWESLKSDSCVTDVLGLEDGFDAVFECTGVESCMQMAVLVSDKLASLLVVWLSLVLLADAIAGLVPLSSLP